jgi:hypothetical protein
MIDRKAAAQVLDGFDGSEALIATSPPSSRPA